MGKGEEGGIAAPFFGVVVDFVNRFEVKRGGETVNECMGYSDATQIKQACLKDFIRMHMKIAQGVMNNISNYWVEKTYLYFDVNSGAGKDVAGNDGSPIIFLKEAHEEGIKFKALFIDQSQDCINALEESVCDEESVTCRCGKQTDIMGEILNRPASGKKFMGILYTDPNGIFDHDILSKFSRHKDFDRVDILINCNSTAIKRLGSDRHRLDERLSTIKKKHWLVREPIGRWQWTMLFGCNWAGYPELKKHKFYKIGSNQGRQIFRRLNLTAQEIKKNPTQLTLSIFEQTSSGAFGPKRCNDSMGPAMYAATKHKMFTI